MIDRHAEAITSRSLLLRGGEMQEKVLVELGPLKNHDADVSCTVRIVGEHSEESREIYGIDAIQALQLALRYLGSRLNAVADFQFVFDRGL